jgi:hypothetical protein
LKFVKSVMDVAVLIGRMDMVVEDASLVKIAKQLA